MTELTASVQSHGILQQVIVLPVEENQYGVVAGEGRYKVETRL
jgi:ParB-like chromosome segregation protein Spo0J